MKRTALLTAALAACTLLAACSGGSQSFTSLPAAGTTQNAAHTASPNLARTGIAPRFFNLIHSLRPASRHVTPAKAPADLFINDFSTNVVDLFANRKWHAAGTITSGVDGPDGNFVDKNGRLYVTNVNNATIAEYAAGATSPMFSYEAGMKDPVDVAVDKAGRVYEADWNSGILGAGFVNEYPAGVDSVLRSCSPDGSVEGVVVDGYGNVFVSLDFADGTAGIIEYARGLKGCHATKLGIPLQAAGGMAMDAQGNLIVCDQFAATVNVIPPPYTSITGTLGLDWVDPFHVSINKKNDQVYVSDPGAGFVAVLHYPSGAFASIIGAYQGLVDPLGAVDGQNYVP